MYLALVMQHMQQLKTISCLSVALTFAVALACVHELYISLVVFFFLLIKYQNARVVLIGLLLSMYVYGYHNWHTTVEFEIPKQLTILELGKQTKTHTHFIGRHEELTVYVTLESPSRYEVGDVVQLDMRCEAVSEKTVPHTFDFKTYLQSKQIYQTCYATDATRVEQKWVLTSLQAKGIQYVNSQFNELVGSYIRALFLGDDGTINETVQTQASTLGVLHLFAISGLHITLLSELVLTILKRVGLIKTYRENVLMISLIGFGIVTAFSASVFRAVLMKCLDILNERCHWQLSAFDRLSLVFIVAVLINPNQVMQLGFLYSYSLTFCLLASTQSSPLFLAIYLMLWTLPIQFATSGTWYVLTFVANLICVPVMSQLVIPCLLLTFFVPPLQDITTAILASFEWLLNELSQLAIFKVTWGVVNVNMCMVLALALIVGKAKSEQTKRNQTFLNYSAVMLAIIGVSSTLQLPKVSMIDVGQGDSFLFHDRTCQMLIDTGGKMSFGREGTSQFEQILKPYLEGEGIYSLDYLVITHSDWDHLGEAIFLIQQFDVQNLVVSAYDTGENLEALLAVAKAHDVSIHRVKKGDQLTCGSVTSNVIHPDEQASDVNDNSIVMEVAFHEMTFLMTGDISSAVESRLAVSDVEVYKVAHHGSSSSNAPDFLEKVNPELALVSAGRHNSYGHPHSQVVDYFTVKGIPLYQTNVHGTVELVMTPFAWKIETMRE